MFKVLWNGSESRTLWLLLKLLCVIEVQMQRGSEDAAAGREENTGTSNTLQTKMCEHWFQWWYWLSVLQALRCLRGRKRVERRADNLFAKLESIRGILDRIAQSQTDKMVRGGANIQHSFWSGPDFKCVVNTFAGHTSVSGRSGSTETLSEGRDCGTGREPRGSNPGGSWTLHWSIMADKSVWFHVGLVTVEVNSLDLIVNLNQIINFNFTVSFLWFHQLCDTQDEVNQTISSVTSAGMTHC